MFNFFKSIFTKNPHCYMHAKEGHIREMLLVKKGWQLQGQVELENGKIIHEMTWPHPWPMTQGCFQCHNCGRLLCYEHSDDRITCDCGARNWEERKYLQQQYDND